MSICFVWKQLQPLVDEERKKGNIACIKYDKLVVKKPKDKNRGKRTRESSDSLNQEAQKKASKSKTPQSYTKKQTEKSTTNKLKQNQQKICLPQRLVPAGALDQNPPAKRSETFNIATLNTRTLRTQESLLELDKALENVKYDILSISEIRRVGEKITELNEYILYHKGETPGQRGVGFLIKMAMKNYIQELIGVSDRIVILNINLPRYKKPWTIIQTYAPTEQAPESESDAFYCTLSDIIKQYHNNFIIVMGDFNAQVGCREPGEELILGKYGYGKRSANGHRLIELLLQNNLTLLNTVFKKDLKTKWTWLSPDGKYKNEIDFVITNKPKFFNDTHIIKNLNFNTNHRMVRCRLKKYPTKRSRDKIKNKMTVEQHREKIDLSLIDNLKEILNSNRSAIEKYDLMIKQLSRLRKGNITKEVKFSEKTMELLKERNALIKDKSKTQEN
ncbi:craniofacial development protein 2-like [Aricia agestis]|uniref:craniofacial development protein 2-like n=1 Tax=Aricia agestis TaxID=91739 RepID=UPI001C202BC9|nr:craniofacial development protein 2-like [Aricia agestis]